ncbi:MAG: SRPBCC family protein [Vicinamibacterales bacterium]
MAVETFHRLGTEGLAADVGDVRRPVRRERRWQRMNVGSMERWLSVVAGGALAAYALRRREKVGGAAALAGAALLYRGATGHCDVYEALGVNRARGEGRGTGVIADFGSDTRQRLGGARGIHVEESVTINRPIGEVYRFWRNFENLPTFMQHLESVAMREAGVSHWVARGPAGMKVEWDARIINEVENKVIGWQSLEGATVSTAGSVNFDQDPHGTRVTVHLQYNPPGGRLGAAVARLFGEEPNQTIREDLRRFKRLIETGEVPTTEGQPSGRRMRYSVWNGREGVPR